MGYDAKFYKANARAVGVVLLAVLSPSVGTARADLAGDRAINAKEALALVERWQAAQNKGDFAAYQALYATAFRGVRRSGARVSEFDRAGWLADRERMF